MKPSYILVFFLLFVPYLATGQKRTATDANMIGHVVRAGSDEHLPFVGVSLKGTSIGTVTDRSGHYSLKHLPEGTHTFIASVVGFIPQEIEVEIVRNRTIEVNFELEEDAMDVDEVVVSASRNETTKRESPTVVNIVSQKTFEATSSQNLAQSLSFQPGLRIENNCSNCGTTQLRINGLDGQYSQILLDSRPIFSSLAGVYGLEQLPVSMIERVEVIRGGGSALFGANAIGGIVNIITREPLYNTISVSNTTGIFKGGAMDMNTSLNGSFVSEDYRTGIYLFGMIRHRDPYDHNGDGFSDIPKINSETVGFRAYHKTGTTSRVTAEYHHIHEFRRGGDAFDLPPHQAMIAEQAEHQIDGGGLTFEWWSSDYRDRFTTYGSAQRIARKSYYGTDMNPDAYGNTGDKTFVLGGQYTHLFRNFLFSPSELTTGAEFSHNGLNDRFIGYDRELSQQTNIVGAFLQNEWKTGRTNILLGGRLDKHNMMKNAVFSPRVNFRYGPSENASFRLSYSGGYRAPQAYDEDLHVGAVGGEVELVVLDPDLKPEYSHSVSGSADLYRNFGRWQTNLLVEGFYTYLDNVFALSPGGEDESGNLIMIRSNASGATVAGVNLEGKAGIAGKVELQAGYTF